MDRWVVGRWVDGWMDGWVGGWVADLVLVRHTQNVKPRCDLEVIFLKTIFF
jgi:hypothetical protein